MSNQGIQALMRGGQPLPPSMRAFLELRLGHAVGDVRIHTGVAAARTAAALDARAFTVGSHIGFGQGEYAPGTGAGRRLLAHEAAHVRQNGGRPDVVRRQPRAPTPQPDRNLLQPPSPAHSTMERAAFEATLRGRFGVRRIATGTEAEQRTLATPRGGTPAGGIVLPDWRPWDPGPTSPAYSSILAALESTATSLGGVPAIHEVIFFRVQYNVGATGIGVPAPDTGASFGGGHLTIYERTVTAHKGLPTGRSTPAGNYPPVGVAAVGPPSETSGAPVPLPTPDQSIGRIITHELGHGVGEAASAADPQTFAEYRKAAGWTAGEPARLFDVGQPPVQQALLAGTIPPAASEIVPDTWNAATWMEQPVSRYMVAGGPGEDFAEAIMTYVQEPNVLLARSPARFRFIAANRERWLPHLMRLPQIGDFPQPSRDRVPA